MKHWRLTSILILAVSALQGANGLHEAAYNDDLPTVESLLKSGADPKEANRYGVTPLSLACTNGNASMVNALLKAGADPNAPNSGGETPLMTAARTGVVEVVQALIAAGADVNAKERRGQTALMWAAAEGHATVVQTLLSAKADRDVKLGSGYTAFTLAVREGQKSVVLTMLETGSNPNETIQTSLGGGPRIASGAGVPRPGNTALHLATVNGHFELASILLDAGADPNAIGVGYTPLHILSWVRKPGGGDNDPAPRGSGSMTSLDLAKKLVAKGANINARMTKKMGVGLTSLNTAGATPFLLAARTGDAELMRTLAALGADTKIPTVDNATPLIVAAGLGTRSPGEDAGTEAEVLEAVQTALELGNDIDAIDNNGETAMHGAAYKNLPKVVEFLASKGANPMVWNQKNKQGWTPLTIAEGYRFGNFKPSPDTVAALHKVMTAAGLPIPADPRPDMTSNSDYKPKK